MKKSKIVIFAALILAVGAAFIAFHLSGTDEPLNVPLFAQSAVVMDLQGLVLFEKEAHAAVYPSSTTKLLAVAVVLAKIASGYGSFDDMVEISQEAADVRASRAGFVAGDVASVYDLIMAAMLPSGSEAVMALGEHFFGNEVNFVAEMNNFARNIGMNGSNFTNSVGLHESNHVTTAYDLGLLAVYMWQNQPEIFSFTSLQFYEFKDTQGRTMPMRNTNDMLEIDGVTGLKTGSGPLSGSSLVFTYESRRRNLIFVVMSSPDGFLRRFDSQSLLEALR